MSRTWEKDDFDYLYGIAFVSMRLLYPGNRQDTLRDGILAMFAVPDRNRFRDILKLL